MRHRWFGVDLGDLFAAEIDPRSALEHHALTSIGPALRPALDLATSHTVGGTVARQAVCLRFADELPQLSGDDAAQRVAGLLGGVPDDDLAAQAVHRRSGRAFLFPGQPAIQGAMSAADIVGASVIDEVVGSGVPVGPDDLVETGGYVRPVFAAGRLVLFVGPAQGGRFVPLETATRHTCCAGVH